MKGTDIAGESDIDVMVFGCGASPISEYQWNSIVSGIKQRGYTIDGVNPRCIHVKVERARNCLVTIEFDVVAHHRQGFPPNKEPNNPVSREPCGSSSSSEHQIGFQGVR